MPHDFAEAKIQSSRPTASAEPSRPLAALRKLVREAAGRTSVERCELCSLPLPPEHQHLIEPKSRRLACACEACAILFDVPAGGGRYRRVPRRIRFVPGFMLTDAQWDRFLIPINMAFFFESSPEDRPENRIEALYPSPAGATESLVDHDAWQNLVEENPILASLQPDVEALLVNRLGARYGFATPEYYLAPIDECYKLVGLLRTHWRGFSGGVEVWQQIAAFYKQLKERAVTVATAGVARDGFATPAVVKSAEPRGPSHA